MQDKSVVLSQRSPAKDLPAGFPPFFSESDSEEIILTLNGKHITGVALRMRDMTIVDHE